MRRTILRRATFKGSGVGQLVRPSDRNVLRYDCSAHSVVSTEMIGREHVQSSSLRSMIVSTLLRLHSVPSSSHSHGTMHRSPLRTSRRTMYTQAPSRVLRQRPQRAASSRSVRPSPLRAGSRPTSPYKQLQQSNREAAWRHFLQCTGRIARLAERVGVNTVVHDDSEQCAVAQGERANRMNDGATSTARFNNVIHEAHRVTPSQQKKGKEAEENIGEWVSDTALPPVDGEEGERTDWGLTGESGSFAMPWVGNARLLAEMGVTDLQTAMSSPSEATAPSLLRRSVEETAEQKERHITSHTADMSSPTRGESRKADRTQRNVTSSTSVTELARVMAEAVQAGLRAGAAPHVILRRLSAALGRHQKQRSSTLSVAARRLPQNGLEEMNKTTNVLLCCFLSPDIATQLMHRETELIFRQQQQQRRRHRRAPLHRGQGAKTSSEVAREAVADRDVTVRAAWWGAEERENHRSVLLCLQPLWESALRSMRSTTETETSDDMSSSLSPSPAPVDDAEATTALQKGGVFSVALLLSAAELAGALGGTEGGVAVEIAHALFTFAECARTRREAVVSHAVSVAVDEPQLRRACAAAMHALALAAATLWSTSSGPLLTSSLPSSKPFSSGGGGSFERAFALFLRYTALHHSPHHRRSSSSHTAAHEPLTVSDAMPSTVGSRDEAERTRTRIASSLPSAQTSYPSLTSAVTATTTNAGQPHESARTQEKQEEEEELEAYGVSRQVAAPSVLLQLLTSLADCVDGNVEHYDVIHSSLSQFILVQAEEGFSASVVPQTVAAVCATLRALSRVALDASTRYAKLHALHHLLICNSVDDVFRNPSVLVETVRALSVCQMPERALPVFNQLLVPETRRLALQESVIGAMLLCSSNGLEGYQRFVSYSAQRFPLTEDVTHALVVKLLLSSAVRGDVKDEYSLQPTDTIDAVYSILQHQSDSKTAAQAVAAHDSGTSRSTPVQFGQRMDGSNEAGTGAHVEEEGEGTINHGASPERTLFLRCLTLHMAMEDARCSDSSEENKEEDGRLQWPLSARTVQHAAGTFRAWCTELTETGKVRTLSLTTVNLLQEMYGQLLLPSAAKSVNVKEDGASFSAATAAASTRVLMEAHQALLQEIESALQALSLGLLRWCMPTEPVAAFSSSSPPQPLRRVGVADVPFVMPTTELLALLEEHRRSYELNVTSSSKCKAPSNALERGGTVGSQEEEEKVDPSRHTAREPRVSAVAHSNEARPPLPRMTSALRNLSIEDGVLLQWTAADLRTFLDRAWSCLRGHSQSASPSTNDEGEEEKREWYTSEGGHEGKAKVLPSSSSSSSAVMLVTLTDFARLCELEQLYALRVGAPFATSVEKAAAQIGLCASSPLSAAHATTSRQQRTERIELALPSFRLVDGLGEVHLRRATEESAHTSEDSTTSFFSAFPFSLVDFEAMTGITLPLSFSPSPYRQPLSAEAAAAATAIPAKMMMATECSAQTPEEHARRRRGIAAYWLQRWCEMTLCWPTPLTTGSVRPSPSQQRSDQVEMTRYGSTFFVRCVRQQLQHLPLVLFDGEAHRVNPHTSAGTDAALDNGDDRSTSDERAAEAEASMHIGFSDDAPVPSGDVLSEGEEALSDPSEAESGAAKHRRRDEDAEKKAKQRVTRRQSSLFVRVATPSPLKNEKRQSGADRTV